MPLLSEILLPVRHKARDYKLSAWFRDSGQELVVFVHGIGCSKENWKQAWERRELRGKSLLAIDLPGCGHSPRPAGFSYELEEHAGMLAALIDSYALRSINLIAHSMGGAIALLLPERTLARFKNLILVEPRLRQSSCSFAAEAAQCTFERFSEEVFPRFRQRAAGDLRTAFDLDRADPEAFYRSGCSLMNRTQGTEMLDRFTAVPCTKIFMYGAQNRHLEELGAVDDMYKVEIPRAGHFAMLDNPDAFYGQVGALLAEG